MFESFQKPVSMRIFSWDGDIDTIMKPIDSIRYYKHFMQGWNDVYGAANGPRQGLGWWNQLQALSVTTT